MRRDPQTILTAHRMDPTRRELYVEGPSDRIFLDWLAGEEKDANARIIEVSLVDLPRVSLLGGRRGD